MTLEHLIDLFFLTNGLEIEDSAEPVFAILSEQAAVPGYGQEDLYEDLESLRNLLSGDFSSAMLADIIRCIKEDPSWEMKTRISGTDLLGDAVPVLTEDFQLERREFLHVRPLRIVKALLNIFSTPQVYPAINSFFFGGGIRQCRV